MSFPKIESQKKFRTKIKASKGCFSKGSISKGTHTELGKYFSGKLINVSAQPKSDYFGAHWAVDLDSSEGEFRLVLPIKGKQMTNFFNSLANVDDFSKPLNLKVYVEKANPDYPNKKLATLFLIMDEKWEDFTRFKYKYLARDSQPAPGEVYFPVPQYIMHNGEPLEIEGIKQKDWKPVNRFIKTKIVDMVNAKLQSVPKEVPGDDFLSEDDLPNTFDAKPEVETIHKNNVNRKQLFSSDGSKTLDDSGKNGYNASQNPIPKDQVHDLDDLPF